MPTEAQQARRPGSSAVILPRTLERNQEFVVQLDGWTEFASSTVEIHIGLTCPSSYLSAKPINTQLDADGRGHVTVPQGFDVDTLWGAHVAHLKCGQRIQIPENNPAALVNWSGPPLNGEQVQVVQEDLTSQNKALHDSPIGDPTITSNRQHRAITLLSGVLTTQHCIYPGLITIPLGERPMDREHLELLNHFLERFKLPVTVDPAKWASSKSNRYPTTAVLIPQIWASDFEEAHRVASEMIARLQLVLSINRLAKAAPIALIVEQRQPDDLSRSRVYPFDTHYRGNLAGGFTAGESPEHLAAEFSGLDNNPIAHLAAGLFADALAEKNEDFRFFKYWSSLETMSERYGMDGPVALTSGAEWPENVGPLDPGPKVYSMIARILSSTKISEKQFSSPASNLYELVQVIKARRNAAAHYGGFDPASPAQQKRRWYDHATKTLGTEQEWLRSARDLNVTVLHFALSHLPEEE